MDYPSPCDGCKRSEATVCAKSCQKYHAFINAWWKHFNLQYRRLCCYTRPESTKKFQYEHPDVYRRYIERGPCPDCAAKENCQTVCATY